jgi:hypothetical protein
MKPSHVEREGDLYQLDNPPSRWDPLTIHRGSGYKVRRPRADLDRHLDDDSVSVKIATLASIQIVVGADRLAPVEHLFVGRREEAGRGVEHGRLAPQPDGPTRVTNSPCRMASSI